MRSYKKLTIRIIESYDDILTATYSGGNETPGAGGFDIGGGTDNETPLQPTLGY